MTTIIIDNYDSFTYNVYQMVGFVDGGRAPLVIRNDTLSAEQWLEHRPSHVILSPGPGHPRDSGLSLSVPKLCPDLPILGICLGHQALAWSAGADVVRAPEPMHGLADEIEHDGARPFDRLPARFAAARYHSLVVDRASLPADWHVSAWTDRGDIMGLRHRTRPHFGVQFHPESFLTDGGAALLESFLSS